MQPTSSDTPRTPAAEPFFPWAKHIAFISYVALFCLTAALFAYAEPTADDFCRGAVREGALAYVTQQYFAWSGRWAAHAVEVFALGRLSTPAPYPLLIGGVAALQALACFVFLAAFFRHLPRRLIAALTAALCALFWTGHPSVGEGFYWFTGAIEYQLNIALSLLLFAMLIASSDAAASARTRKLGWLLCMPLAVVATSMHELWGCFLCAVLIAGAAGAYRSESSARSLWACCAAASALALIVVLAAPGNQLRAAAYPHRFDLVYSARPAVAQAIKAGSRWIFDLRLWAASALFVLHPRIAMSRPPWLRNSGIAWERIAPAVWLALLGFGFWAPVFATGGESLGRVLGAVYFLFLIGWFLTLFVLTRGPAFDHIVSAPLFRPLCSVLLLVFSLSLLATGNARVAVHDLIHRVEPWHQAIHERYRLIQEDLAQGGASVSIPAVPAWPESYYGNDIASRPSNWKNVCLADYFGIDAVRLATPTDGVAAGGPDRSQP